MRTRASCRWWLVWASLLVVGSGCAPKGTFSVWRPAELDVQGIDRLAIIDFEGPADSGKIVRASLVANFWDNRHYTLVDQAELQRVRPIFSPNGQPDVAAAVDAARQIGVDAVLAGQVVSYSVADDKSRDFQIGALGGGASTKDGAAKGGGEVQVSSNETLRREASVGLSFQLIDVRTGAIRAANQRSHSFNGESVNGRPLPGRERLLADLTNQCSQDVLALLAPHHATNEVVLARQFYGKGLSELRRGNALATNGNWGGAEAAWEAALKQSRQNHAAMYNLALAAEARGDYATALLRVGQAIDTYGDTMYHDLRKKLDDNRVAYLAAMAQVGAQEKLVAARLAPAPSPETTLR